MESGDLCLKPGPCRANLGYWQKKSWKQDKYTSRHQEGGLTDSLGCASSVRRAVELRGPVIGSSKKIRDKKGIQVRTGNQGLDARFAERCSRPVSCILRIFQGSETMSVSKRSTAKVRRKLTKEGIGDCVRHCYLLLMTDVVGLLIGATKNVWA